jgi:hypothetical protein
LISPRNRTIFITNMDMISKFIKYRILGHCPILAMDIPDRY